MASDHDDSRHLASMMGLRVCLGARGGGANAGLETSCAIWSARGGAKDMPQLARCGADQEHLEHGGATSCRRNHTSPCQRCRLPSSCHPVLCRSWGVCAMTAKLAMEVQTMCRGFMDGASGRRFLLWAQWEIRLESVRSVSLEPPAMKEGHDIASLPLEGF